MEPFSTTPADVLNGEAEGYAERLAGLSARERMVVDLAATGRTDEQIAQTLGLSISTVSSYWVRIRGKLGMATRVEIVADLLRHQANHRFSELTAENRRLRATLEKQSQELIDLRRRNATLLNEALSSVALDRLPDAVLITEPPAQVIFANREALRLYRAQPSHIEGQPMRALSTATTPDAIREPCRQLFEENIERETVGIDEPYYARRHDGSNFRAVLRSHRFESTSGPRAVVIVREFLSDAETIFRALRQPLVNA